MVENIYAQLLSIFKKYLPEDQARALVVEVEGLFGGLQQYFPKGKVTENEKNRQICDRFNGKNVRALAREFDLSEVHIRRILKAHSATKQ